MNSNLECKVCNDGKIKRFLTLGNIPPVNAFLDPSEISKEKAYPLNLAYCSSCLLVQLENIVPPEKLFSNYLHLSSGSSSNINHLKEVADSLNSRLKINKNTKVLEVGSNDGTLLAFLKEYTSNLLGIDPAKNLVKLSKQKGIETLPEFFNTSTASKIEKARGTFDILVALNVIPHTPNVVDFLKGAYKVLNSGGTLVMEGAYALETILRGEFDTIYHEHVYSFSLHSLISAFKCAGLKVTDVEKIPTQGGSLRILAQKAPEAALIYPSVNILLEEEKNQGLIDPKIYNCVESKVKNFKNNLKKIVEEEKKKSGKLIGLGAPARGVVILNYCNLGINDMNYLIDDTPLKQGKFAPGVHIPVKSWEALKSYKNQTFLLLSWNYKEHLISKLQNYIPSFRIIIPFPNLEVKEYG